ncbi:MAG TPA: type II secretion system protein N [Steroidobacteraceae bacterium]|nr:type II secretion system protein N [Steroidobacteraceae bacterium]
MNFRKALLLGLVAFALALLVVLPARWMNGVLPAGVQCGQWSGSIWRGQCVGLTMSDAGKVVMKLGALRWKLRPMALLGLKVSADFQSSWANGQATGRVAVSPGGTIQLRDMVASTLLDPTALGALPAGWSGRAELARGEFDWEGGTLGRLGGVLEVSGLTDRRGTDLGSYRLELPAGSTPPFTGQLVDTGGPVQVEAQFQLAADRMWSLEGRMRQRNPADIRLGRQLDMLGIADAAGWRRLSAAGDFN